MIAGVFRGPFFNLIQWDHGWKVRVSCGEKVFPPGMSTAVTVTRVITAIRISTDVETGIRVIGLPRFQQSMGGDTTMSMPVTSPGEEVLAR